MTFRCEYRFPDLPDWAQIGGEFADQISAVRQTYDLKNRMPYITDYRVISSDGAIVFSRGKPCEALPRPLLREGAV